MTMWSSRNPYLSLTAALLLGGLGVLGCGQKNPPAVTANQESTSQTKESIPARSGETVSATPVSRAAAAPDRLHQPFTEAVRSAEDPPPGDAVRPPDETVSKKPVHRLLDAVKSHWDSIRFISDSGKPIDYLAQIETNMGTIEIALFPEQAPNHVRNFIALAKAGYYDQLFFERIRHEKNDKEEELHLLEAGCPLGTGLTGTGSIGYWLKEEFTPSDKMGHDEGTVGACRGEEADSAATRFYISLTRAPFLDGHYTIFGKVITGLDILRKMGQVPVVIDEEGMSRPQSPLTIHKVTIQANERK